MSAEPDLDVTVTLTPADIARGYLHVALGSNRRSKLLPLAVLAGALAAGLALFHVFRGGTLPLSSVVVLAVLTVLTAGTPLAVYALALRSHRMLPSPRAAWSVGREGVRVKSGARTESLSWDRIVRVEEARDALYVYSTATSFRILPLRGLEPALRTALVDRFRRRC